MPDAYIFWAVRIRDPYLFLRLVSFGVPTVAYWRIYRNLGEMAANTEKVPFSRLSRGEVVFGNMLERGARLDGLRGLCGQVG